MADPLSVRGFVIHTMFNLSGATHFRLTALTALGLQAGGLRVPLCCTALFAGVEGLFRVAIILVRSARRDAVQLACNAEVGGPRAVDFSPHSLEAHAMS